MNWIPEPHQWVKFPVVGRDRCVKCGLLALRNQFSQWCIKMGCDHMDHPQYLVQRNTCRRN